MPARIYRWASAAAALAVLAASVFWAVVSPAFSGPDETPHFNSVSRLVAGGGWPEPYDARIRSDTWLARAEAGVRGGRLEDGAVAPEVPPPDERSALHADSPFQERGRDYMVQHPPGGYLAAVAVVSVAGGADLRWDRALLLMRVTSGVLLAAAVPFVIGAVRHVSGSRAAGMVGGAMLLSVPFLSTSSGFVTNDSMLVMTSSAAIWGATRAIARPGGAPWSLMFSGVMLGAALFTKGLALPLIPVIAVLSATAGWRRRGRVADAVLLALATLTSAFALGGWWWLRNLLVLGRIQPSQLGGRSPVDDLPEPDYWFFFTGFWQRLNRLFWGRGADESIAFPEVVVDVAGVVLLLAVVAALVLSPRRLLFATLLFFPGALVAVLWSNALRVYVDLGRPDRGIQGRYLFAAIVVYATVWGLLWCRLRSRSSPAARASAMAAPVGAASITVLGAIWATPRLYGTDSVTAALALAADASDISPAVLAGLVGTFVAAVVVMLLSAWRPEGVSPSVPPASPARRRTR